MMMGFLFYFYVSLLFSGGWYGFVLYSVLGIQKIYVEGYSEREFKVKMLEGLRYELSIYNVCADEGGFIHLNILV